MWSRSKFIDSLEIFREVRKFYQSLAFYKGLNIAYIYIPTSPNELSIQCFLLSIIYSSIFIFIL